MEEIIKHIDMEMLKSYSYQGSYTDEYLFFTDKLENIFQENKNVKLEFFLMIYCIEGEIKLELNNSPHHLHQKDLIISLPNTIIGQVLASPNHKIKIICFSNRLLQRLTQTEKYTWKWVCYIQKNPIKHFEGEEEKLFNQYLDLIESKAQTGINKIQKEILSHIASAFFGEMISHTTKKSVETDIRIPKTNITQSDFLFKQFMEALAADNGKHRTLILLFSQISFTNHQTNQWKECPKPYPRKCNRTYHLGTQIFQQKHQGNSHRLRLPEHIFLCTICKKTFRNDTY